MADILFDDSTDYEEVEYQVRSRYAEIVAKETCCKKTNAYLCVVAQFLLAADIDKAIPDTVRYNDAIKSAYLYLFQ